MWWGGSRDQSEWATEWEERVRAEMGSIWVCARRPVCQLLSYIVCLILKFLPLREMVLLFLLCSAACGIQLGLERATAHTFNVKIE